MTDRSGTMQASTRRLHRFDPLPDVGHFSRIAGSVKTDNWPIAEVKIARTDRAVLALPATVGR